MTLQQEIESLAPPSTRYLFGYADLSGILAPQYNKYPYGISVARKLDDTIIDSIEAGPNRPYFDLYHAVNRELAETVSRIAAALNARGVESLAVPPTFEDQGNDDVYNRTLRKSFSHKMTATRAGIGWIGKTDLLITEKFGPRVRFSSVLTTSAIGPIGTPITESRCGTCSLCVDRCPARAATGKAWNTAIDRNEFYDPFKCRDNCRAMSKANMNENITLCGICVSVCPKGKQGD
jgi:epoxyqueuosine reductase QueG